MKIIDTPISTTKFKLLKCQKCDVCFNMPENFIGRIICKDCDPAMNKQCDHWYRFLDYLKVKKDKGAFYCQKCLEIKEIIIGG